jgi:peptidoglycan-associated lipoprotein
MKFIKPLLLCFLIAFSIGVSAQTVKQANQAFDHEQYFHAIDLYKKAYAKEKSNAVKAEIIFKIAECYRHIEDEPQAEVWYRKSIQAQYPDPIAVFYLAEALRCIERYDEAIEEYQKYNKLRPGNKIADHGIECCNHAIEWKATPTKHIIHNEVMINTPFMDYAPAFASNDYSSIIFTSTRPEAKGGIAGRHGENYEDLFFTKRDNKGKWSTPVPLPGTINTEQSEGSGSLNMAKDMLYFTRCRHEKDKFMGCHIYYSKKEGDSWGPSEELKISDNDTLVIAHPAISGDGSHLFFVSDMPGGKGGKDIWMIKFNNESQSWSTPINVPGVNTVGNEFFPYYREDGDLYFASDGHIGMGGFDIFRSQKVGDDVWGNVENMKYPINSPMNDFGFIMEEENERGYFSSDRIGGKGGEDIYSYYIQPLIFVIKGEVLDVDSREPVVGAKVKLVGSDGSMVEIETDENGNYEFAKMQGEDDRYVKANTTYALEIHKPQYLSGKGEVTTVGFEESHIFEQKFTLQSITKNEIEFPEVLYDLAKWSLRPESKDSLNFLYQVLIDNPTIVIELSAHTDSRGSDAYNMDLSQKRAQSCVDYLIEKGIHKDRLVPKGYGESTPIFSESDIAKFKTEEEREAAHQKNRRTVFKVLRDDFVGKDN